MRKRMVLVAAITAAVSLAPIGIGGGGSARAMTCVADPPIDTGCQVVFGVLYTACTGQPPKLPRVPIGTSAAVGWPIDCPPMG